MTVVLKDKERDLCDISISDIEVACCASFEVDPKSFKDPKVSNGVVCSSRQAYWLILRKVKPMSFALIGEPFDRGKDNVHQGISAFKKKMKERESVRKAFLRIGVNLNAVSSINAIAEEVTGG